MLYSRLAPTHLATRTNSLLLHGCRVCSLHRVRFSCSRFLSRSSTLTHPLAGLLKVRKRERERERIILRDRRAAQDPVFRRRSVRVRVQDPPPRPRFSSFFLLSALILSEPVLLSTLSLASGSRDFRPHRRPHPNAQTPPPSDVPVRYVFLENSFLLLCFLRYGESGWSRSPLTPKGDLLSKAASLTESPPLPG